MKIKIKVKRHDYDDADVTVEIDDKEFYPNLPTIDNSIILVGYQIQMMLVMHIIEINDYFLIYLMKKY